MMMIIILMQIYVCQDDVDIRKSARSIARIKFMENIRRKASNVRFGKISDIINRSIEYVRTSVNA